MRSILKTITIGMCLIIFSSQYAFASVNKKVCVPMDKCIISKVAGTVKTTKAVKIYATKKLKGKVIKLYKKGAKIKITKIEGKVATVNLKNKKYYCNATNIKFDKLQVAKARTKIVAYNGDLSEYATAPKGTQMVLEKKIVIKNNQPYYYTIIVE